jgi:tRNA-2-methylthio-N6-dimethylallyladenosine synthase
MRIYVETYGCQMNEYDTKMIRSMLARAGHTFVGRPADADAVIVNTCAVRERAERRVLGRIAHLKGLAGPRTVLGVVGCVAQRLGDALSRGPAGVDFVVGTDRYDRLADVLSAAAQGRRTIDTGLDPSQRYEGRPAPCEAGLCEFVSVMRGCDNFCSYWDRALGFSDLLRRVDGVPGLRRIRFATSHPKDLSDELIETIASTERVCEHIHLPVQSGSDAVLRAMNRSYTRGEYVDLVRRIRAAVPAAALTTDVIVGFPGETEEDHRLTLSLLEEIRFDSAFMFRYSVREGTRAASLADDVPERTKIRRLEEVISLERNTALVGRAAEVLVEGGSARDASLLFGRTRTGKATVFEGPRALTGEIARVEVRSATAWTLHGDVIG